MLLNYCMLLPGPEAQQLATYIGWLDASHAWRHPGRRLLSCPEYRHYVLSYIYAAWGTCAAAAFIMSGRQFSIAIGTIETVLR